MAKYSLEVDTGLVEVEIKDPNGKVLGSFEFLPTDTNIANRYADVVKKLNDVELPEELLAENVSDDATLRFHEEFGNLIKDQFDYLFGDGVSKGVFAMCGPLTFLENGDFYYEHVIEKIGDLVEKILNARMDAKITKIREATKKYDNE